ncbi:MAG: restriction endonuclease [Syntrophobacteraceae bacterium]
MARRNGSILDDLVLLPWWINVILAVVVYFSFKYWIPTIAFQNPFYKDFAVALHSFAPVAAGVLLFVAAISAFNAWRKGQLLERQKGIGTLRAISWQEFEELVGEAYRRKGYAVTETGGGGADGGVDLFLRKGGERLLVQCKHWRMDKVGVKVVRELYGVVAAEGATGGVVISSGTFTQEARDFARGKPVELLDGSELIKLIAEVQRTPTQISKKSDGSACPLCGAEMVLRTAKKGAKAGEKFWGCSTFPKCRSTKPYSA